MKNASELSNKTGKDLQESNNLLQSIIREATDTIFVKDISGRYILMNSAGANIMGKSIEEIIGKDDTQLFPHNVARKLMEEDQKIIASEKEIVFYEEVPKNGKIYNYHTVKVPYRNYSGNIIGVIGIARDVTEQKEAEEEIKQLNESLEQRVVERTAELARANEELQNEITERKQMEKALLQSEKLKSIGTITAGISHEFNNILAIISGNIQLLEGSRKDDEELTDALSTIKRATNDGAKISRRMLKFTKTAKDTVGFVPFDINELINVAIDFTMPRWKNMAQAKGINYHMDTEGMKKRVPSILCNPTEIREVFVNIINNALDAMPDDGRITFRTWNGEDTVFISVSDTGEGMSEKVKKNIFDPFFTTKVAVGTGLGMSTAYGIIIGHGGNIEVESEVGRGSTFTLQFPAAAKADSPKESPESEQEIKTNSLCILVVDDEEDICNILDKFLSKRGHLVRTVDNGKGAIILTRAADFDLVLCDMAMPNVYGYDVIRALNKLEKRPKIGIITGWGEKLKPIDDEDLKVDFIIKKPFDFTELTKHINDVFNT